MKNNKIVKYLNIALILKVVIYIIVLLDYDLYNRCIWIWKLKGIRFCDIYYNGINFTASNGNIDYPPVYPIYEWIISQSSNWKHSSLIEIYNSKEIILLLFQKLPSMIVDIAFTIRLIIRKDYKKALIWCLLPINIVFGCIFGLSDIIIGVCIWLFIEYANDRKYSQLVITTVLCCLVKQQGLYLVIIGIVYILHQNINIRQKIKYIISGIIAVYLCWLPFVIGNKDILLPVKFYTIVLDRWKSLTKGCPNIWSITQVLSELFNIQIEISNIPFIVISILISYIVYIKSKDIVLMISSMTFNISVLCQNQIVRYLYYFVIAHLLYKKLTNVDKFSILSIMLVTIINTTLQWYNEMSNGSISVLYFLVYIVSSVIVIYIFVVYYINLYKNIKTLGK